MADQTDSLFCIFKNETVMRYHSAGTTNIFFFCYRITEYTIVQKKKPDAR